MIRALVIWIAIQRIRIYPRVFINLEVRTVQFANMCAREGYHQLRPIPYELVHIIYDDLIHDSKDQYFCITIDPGITIV